MKAFQDSVPALLFYLCLMPLARAVTIDTVPVGNAGNAGDLQPLGTFGAVVYNYRISKYEVTFEEWDVCVADGGCNRYRPSDENWGRSRRPVINVSWEDAKAYIDWLSRMTGFSYRLPSEAEWEYAARAGSETAYWWGDDRPTPEQANFGQNVGKTTEVGTYPANPWGLHDMNGNVWEWVEDCWNDSYAAPERPDHGRAWTSGDCDHRVLRGGSNDDPAGTLRSAARYRYGTASRDNDVGFRVARTLSRNEGITP